MARQRQRQRLSTIMTLWSVVFFSVFVLSGATTTLPTPALSNNTEPTFSTWPAFETSAAGNVTVTSSSQNVTGLDNNVPTTPTTIDSTDFGFPNVCPERDPPCDDGSCPPCHNDTQIDASNTTQTSATTLPSNVITTEIVTPMTSTEITPTTSTDSPSDVTASTMSSSSTESSATSTSSISTTSDTVTSPSVITMTSTDPTSTTTDFVASGWESLMPGGAIAQTSSSAGNTTASIPSSSYGTTTFSPTRDTNPATPSTSVDFPIARTTVSVNDMLPDEIKATRVVTPPNPTMPDAINNGGNLIPIFIDPLKFVTDASAGSDVGVTSQARTVPPFDPAAIQPKQDGATGQDPKEPIKSQWWPESGSGPVGDSTGQQEEKKAAVGEQDLVDKIQLVFFIAPCVAALLAVIGLGCVIARASARHRARRRLLDRMKKEQKQAEKKQKQLDKEQKEQQKKKQDEEEKQHQEKQQQQQQQPQQPNVQTKVTEENEINDKQQQRHKKHKKHHHRQHHQQQQQQNDNDNHHHHRHRHHQHHNGGVKDSRK